MAALGVETSAGEFSVVDVCFAGMAPGGVSGRKGTGKGKTSKERGKEGGEDKIEVDGRLIARFEFECYRVEHPLP